MFISLWRTYRSRSHRAIVLITGVSPKSIGQQLVMNIAKHGPGRMILASRTSSKLDTVASEVKKEYPNVSVDTVILDLASQASTRKAAEDVTKLVDRIDILINNAAVVDSELRRTEEGLEMQFGVGHVGHFLFTTLLMPLFETSAKSNKAGATRIINVSSEGHRIGPVRFHDYNFEGKQVPEEEQPSNKQARLKDGHNYSVWVAYGQTKSANILFTLALNDRFGSKGIRSYACHPGGKYTPNFCPTLITYIPSQPSKPISHAPLIRKIVISWTALSKANGSPSIRALRLFWLLRWILL